MKTLNLSIACAAVVLAVGFTSCKKTEALSAAQENATTTELAQNQATSDNMTDDANNVFFEAALDRGAMGSRPIAGRPLTPGFLGDATITITVGSFPKTITVDFGDGTTGTYGIVRSGIVTIVLSGPVRTSGSTAKMTFDNYKVNGYKIEGKINWENTSAGDVKSWRRDVVDGLITAPAGNYWAHSGTRNIVQLEGWDTPLILLDDKFSMTGNHTVTNTAGDSRTATILTALVKTTACRHIQSGSIKFQGPNHYLVVDYGDGTCDAQATYAIDGGEVKAFTLN